MVQPCAPEAEENAGLLAQMVTLNSGIKFQPPYQDLQIFPGLLLSPCHQCYRHCIPPYFSCTRHCFILCWALLAQRVGKISKSFWPRIAMFYDVDKSVHLTFE